MADKKLHSLDTAIYSSVSCRLNMKEQGNPLKHWLLDWWQAFFRVTEMPRESPPVSSFARSPYFYDLFCPYAARSPPASVVLHRPRVPPRLLPGHCLCLQSPSCRPIVPIPRLPAPSHPTPPPQQISGDLSEWGSGGLKMVWQRWYDENLAVWRGLTTLTGGLLPFKFVSLHEYVLVHFPGRLFPYKAILDTTIWD